MSGKKNGGKGGKLPSKYKRKKSKRVNRLKIAHKVRNGQKGTQEEPS